LGPKQPAYFKHYHNQTGNCQVAIGAGMDSSVASSSPANFGISFAGRHMDLPTLSKQSGMQLQLNGSMPVAVATSMHKASDQDAMGGEEMTFKVGDRHPVLVRVWSPHGQNQLTHDKDVRYLNLEVQNLPKGSGGIIGLDRYSRPSTSRCDFIHPERNPKEYTEDEMAPMSFLRLQRPNWTALATVQQ
jgi:hypothetical protein